jgi:hypothetical protein
MQFDAGPYHQEAFYSTIKSVHPFSFGNWWMAELNVSYRSLIPAGVMNLRSMTNGRAGIQKALPNNRDGLRLNINDILWMDQVRWYPYFPDQQFNFRAAGRDSPRIARQSYTPSFGSQKA